MRAGRRQAIAFLVLAALVAAGGGLWSIASAAHDQGGIHVEASDDGVDGDGNTGTAEDADGDDVYGTVQAGVDAAAPGDRVKIADGTFGPTRLTIATEDLTLDGAVGGVTKIRVAGGDEDPIAIRADGVTVRGIRFDHRDGRPEFNVEIPGDRIENVTLGDVRIQEGYVLARRADRLTVGGSVFEDPAAVGGSERAIWLASGGFHEVTIEEMVFAGYAEAAVEVGSGASSNVTIRGSGFRDNHRGLVVGEDADAAVEVRMIWFIGNEVAVRNTGSDPVDVRWNWWNRTAGPSHADNPLTATGWTGERVVGPAAFAPWCVIADCLPNMCCTPCCLPARSSDRAEPVSAVDR